MKNPLILPSPLEVFSKLTIIIQTKIFWLSVLFTFCRVLWAFIISALAGIGIGFLCGLNNNFKSFFEIPLTIIRSTPVIAFILFVVFWFTSGTVPVFVAVMMNFPIMVSTVISGFNKSDKKLMEMAFVFNLNKKEIFKYIQLSSVIPYIKNGLVQTFGLTWKVVVAGEVITLPKNGLGTILHREQMWLETSGVMAVTIFLVTLSFILEVIFSSIANRGGKNEIN